MHLFLCAKWETVSTSGQGLGGDDMIDMNK